MLERDQIIRGLARVAEHLRARDIEGEICLLGGTVMVLAFKARAATKDVDAVFEPAAAIREAAALVEREQDLPPDWLNATPGVDPSDVNDITFLIRHLGLDDPEQALEIVARYYPEDRIPPRARYLLEEIFAGGDSP